MVTLPMGCSVLPDPSLVRRAGLDTIVGAS